MKWFIGLVAGGFAVASGWLAVVVLGAPGLLIYGESLLVLVALMCRARWSPPPPLPPSPLGAAGPAGTAGRRTGRFRLYDAAHGQIQWSTTEARYFDRVLRPELLRLAQVRAGASQPSAVDEIDRALAEAAARPSVRAVRRRGPRGTGPTLTELTAVIQRIEDL